MNKRNKVSHKSHYRDILAFIQIYSALVYFPAMRIQFIDLVLIFHSRGTFT